MIVILTTQVSCETRFIFAEFSKYQHSILIINRIPITVDTPHHVVRQFCKYRLKTFQVRVEKMLNR
jgi:hypothetical protein